MSIPLKRICLLALAILVVAAPISPSLAAAEAPVAGAAKKKGKKKCKKKAKKKGKKAKCKKKAATPGTGGGLPGKPVSPDPPAEQQPLLLQSLALDENPLLGGSSGSAQVTLTGPARDGGQPVTLGSDNTSRVTVPDGVHIAAGQTQASFPVDTSAGGPDTVTLTAAMEGSVRSTQLELVAQADLNSVGIALDYQCFPDVGLFFPDNVVSLNVRAPSNSVVDLLSSDPFTLAVPPTATVPTGSFTGAFSVETLLTTPAVDVTASFNGLDRTDTASIRTSGSPAPVASSLGLQPSSIVVGDPSTGTVRLDCEAPAGGITVSLADNHPDVTMPASVFVPAGALSASFPITTVVSAAPGDVQITATGGASVQAILTLRALGT